MGGERLVSVFFARPLMQPARARRPGHLARGGLVQHVRERVVERASPTTYTLMQQPGSGDEDRATWPEAVSQTRGVCLRQGTSHSLCRPPLMQAASSGWADRATCPPQPAAGGSR